MNNIRSRGYTSNLKWLNNEENSAILLIGLGLFSSSFARLFRWFSYSMLGDSLYGHMLNTAIWFLSLILYVLKYSRGRIVKSIILWSMSASVFLFLMALFFENTTIYFKEYLSEIILLIFRGIPCAILLSKVQDVHILMFKNRILLYAGTFFSVLAYFGGIQKYLGDMEWGLTITPFALFFFGYLFTKSNIYKMKIPAFDIALFICLCILTLLGGRQWMVIFFLCITLTIVFNTGFSVKRLYGIMFLAILILLMYIYSKEILILFSEFLSKVGVHSRALGSIVNGSLMDISNRRFIYDCCREIIINNGIKVSGIFADCFYLRIYRTDIAYAHNMIFELLIDFGVFFGGIIILVVFTKLIKKCFSCSENYRYVLIIFIGLGLFRYFVSSSIFLEDKFVILLGICANTFIDKKRG